MRKDYEFSRRVVISGPQYTVLEAAAWRARELEDRLREGPLARGCKAEVARIRRAIRVLVGDRSQRERLIAITRCTPPKDER